MWDREESLWNVGKSGSSSTSPDHHSARVLLSVEKLVTSLRKPELRENSAYVSPDIRCRHEEKPNKEKYEFLAGNSVGQLPCCEQLTTNLGTGNNTFIIKCSKEADGTSEVTSWKTLVSFSPAFSCYLAGLAAVSCWFAQRGGGSLAVNGSIQRLMLNRN